MADRAAIRYTRTRLHGDRPVAFIAINFIRPTINNDVGRMANVQNEKKMSREPLLHIVLFQPEIPPNTGNIGRTCVAVGAKLWLIRPLGFSLDESQLRRAGLDYWPFLDYELVESWAELIERLPGRTVWCIENPATRTVWNASFSPGDILLFGRETNGLPAHIVEQHRSNTLQFPMYPEVRSLNLANTVCAVVYEAVRQFGGLPGN
jgi:tRNA (cytidine/uridine-2'-O-)-methyltransferase